MDTGQLETTIKALQNQVEAMHKKLTILQDIEEIKTLQRAYGFYLEHWMFQEIVDCFSGSPDVTADFYPIGVWKGKDSIERYFTQHKEYDPQFLHQIMQLNPVIHVDPDGKTAKGRWYGYGPIADPNGPIADELLHSGTYEMEYVKEDGIWKFMTIAWRVNYISQPGQGLVNFDHDAVFGKDFNVAKEAPDVLNKGKSQSYPSGYIYPFHYNHPVTGKKTGEDEINKKLGF